MDPTERPSSRQARSRGGLKGREARQPARGPPGEPCWASVTHLTVCAAGPHRTQEPAACRLPSSGLGTCGTAIARLSSLPSFKRPANGGSGRREPTWSCLRRGRWEGQAVPSPAHSRRCARAAPPTRTPAQSCAVGHYLSQRPLV